MHTNKYFSTELKKRQFSMPQHLSSMTRMKAICDLSFWQINRRQTARKGNLDYRRRSSPRTIQFQVVRLSLSAAIMSLPGRCKALTQMFRDMHHKHRLRVIALHCTLVLPILFMQTTDVVLSLKRSITHESRSLVNACRTRNAAFNSRQLMCSCFSALDHKPFVRTPLQVPPHQELLASE